MTAKNDRLPAVAHRLTAAKPSLFRISKDVFAIIRPKPDRLDLQVVPGSDETYGFALRTHED